MVLFQPSLIDKVRELLALLHQSVDFVGAGSIAVEVFKVYFEEMHFFLDLFEYQFIMTVVFCCLEDSRKKKLIQMSYLVEVEEYFGGLLMSDNLSVEEWSSKI